MIFFQGSMYTVIKLSKKKAAHYIRHEPRCINWASLTFDHSLINPKNQMKQIRIGALLVLAIILHVNSFAQARKKVAVVTFYCDKWIDMSQLDGAASMAATVGTLADDPSFDLKPVLQHFHDVFFNEYAKLFPFDLVPESEVLTNEQYKAFESYWGEGKDEDRGKLTQRYTVIDGYKVLTEMLAKKEKQNQNRMLEILGDKVDGVMFVNLDFSMVPKVAVGGMGTAGISSYCRMKVWNKAGEKVFTVNETANSKGSVAMVKGVPVMKPAEILPLCEDSSNRLIEDLKKRIEKVAKKAAEKL